MFLEVIATNLEDCALINEAGNVNRIELCANLERGGFTPEYDVIKECCENSEIPIRVIVRRCDKNFYCEEAEFEQIKRDISYIKTTKAEGIVIGVISKDHKVDVVRMKELVKLAGNLKITFHRAFDEIIDKVEAVKSLAELHVSTILTQGGLEPILNNLNALNCLRGFGVQIQGGSGVNFENYLKVSEVCDSIHIGSAVRFGNSWKSGIDVEKLKMIK